MPFSSSVTMTACSAGRAARTSRIRMRKMAARPLGRKRSLAAAAEAGRASSPATSVSPGPSPAICATSPPNWGR